MPPHQLIEKQNKIQSKQLILIQIISLHITALILPIQCPFNINNIRQNQAADSLIHHVSQFTNIKITIASF